jgi:ribokinase
MPEPPTVLVVGSVNVDLVVHAERLPARGETVAGGRLERAGGGKGANQAVAAARAGAAVALVGAVGDDDLGADALAALRSEGVDVAAVRRIAGVATGVALIVVDGAGDNQIAVASGANHEVSGDDVRAAVAAALRGGGHDLRPARRPGCVLTGLELLGGPVLAAARIAADAGCPLVVNPAPARPLEPALLELRPILTPNRHEAVELTGEDGPEAAGLALAARTGAPVVVTLGEHGALVVDGDGPARVPAPAVRAVDTTGAGDAFNGALAAELARGRELRAAVEEAVAAAADSVTRPGARG